MRINAKFLAVCAVCWLAIPLAPPLISAVLDARPAQAVLFALHMDRKKMTDCGLVETIRAMNQRLAINADCDVMKGVHRVVSSDSETDLWVTPIGSFWTDKGVFVPDLYGTVAEQNQDIYRLSQLQPGAVVLDCGANYGVTVRAALRLGARLVVAIEPDPRIVACLRRTFAPEIEREAVVVYPKGVWDREDVLALHRSTKTPWGNTFLGPAQDLPDLELPLTTIDKIVSELKLERVDFIKMDIEGAEPRAIAGAAQTIRRFRPRISACVYHDSNDYAAVASAVRRIRTDYREECPCKEWRGRVVRDVAIFH